MLRSEKGITLIALIITIIVMLILVTVSITVALNGGLFGKAEEATMKTQVESDKETLQGAAIAALNSELKIENKLPVSTIPNNGSYIEQIFSFEKKEIPSDLNILFKFNSSLKSEGKKLTFFIFFLFKSLIKLSKKSS